MAAHQRRNSLRKLGAPGSASALQLRSESRSRNGAAEEDDVQSLTQRLRNWVSNCLSGSSTSSPTSPLSPTSNHQQGTFNTSMGHYPPRASETRRPLLLQSTAANGDAFYSGNRGRGRSQSMTRAMDNNSDTGEGYAHTNQERALVLVGPGQQHISSADKDLPPEPNNATGSTNDPNHTDASCADQLLAAREEIKRLTGINARLREKVTDSAASRTDADPLTAFRVPENVIVSDFRALAYRIHNFVDNYYKDQNKRKFKAWAEENHRFLASIYPDFAKVLGEKGTPTWLVEATIWNLLMGTVFTRFADGMGMLWAGRYARRVAKLGDFLAFSINENDLERQRAFHHWRALTTNLATGVDPRETGRDDAVMEIADAIEDLLGPLSTGTRKEIIVGSKAIANEAVELDQKICNQQTCYKLRYPAHTSNGKADSTEVVAVTADGKTVEKKAGLVPYSFVITPLLHRSGGRRGEGYGSSEGVVLELAKVYHAGSHVWSRG